MVANLTVLSIAYSGIPKCATGDEQGAGCLGRLDEGR